MKFPRPRKRTLLLLLSFGCCFDGSPTNNGSETSLIKQNQRFVQGLWFQLMRLLLSEYTIHRVWRKRSRRSILEKTIWLTWKSRHFIIIYMLSRSITAKECIQPRKSRVINALIRLVSCGKKSWIMEQCVCHVLLCMWTVLIHFCRQTSRRKSWSPRHQSYLGAFFGNGWSL